jgi:TRAP-type C4-dicarboxylate transport system substrate-binding protein
MAKYEEVFTDTQDLYTRLITNSNLEHINITILADNKAKKITNTTKANPLMKFRTGDDIIIVLNEKIFEQLPEEQQTILAEESLAGIFYNEEKEAVEIQKEDFIAFSGVIRKYGFDTVEVLRESVKTLYAVEKQAEDEAKNAKTSKKQFS